MKINLKMLAAIQGGIILILLSAVGILLLGENSVKEHEKSGHAQFPLLSQKIISGVMEEKSFAVTNFAPLRKSIEMYVEKNDASLSFYVENLRNGAYTGINEREGYLPASLNKLPLAILIMKKVEAGELSMQTPIKIAPSDRLDTFGTLYATEEEELPLEVMLEEMLSKSDNTAFSALLHYVSSQDIEFMLDYYGLDISMDFPEVQLRNHSNTLSPKAMVMLFSSLYYSTILTTENSQYLLSLMENERNVFDVKAAAQIPNEVGIVHKFGEHAMEESAYFHDCGIMYFEEKRYFYCVMSKAQSIEEARRDSINVINQIYQYLEWAIRNNDRLAEVR